MAVVAANLIVPAGLLKRVVIAPDRSDIDFAADLTAYIADGTAQATARSVATADVDTFVKNWAYYRAYFDKWQQMSGDPTNAAIVSEESVAWAPDQRANFEALWRQFLANAELVVPTIDPDVSPGIPDTATTPLVYTW